MQIEMSTPCSLGSLDYRAMGSMKANCKMTSKQETVAPVQGG